ncbi:hypothetical protein ACWF0M_21385 [Kribbella sp. NPDC055110]
MKHDHADWEAVVQEARAVSAAVPDADGLWTDQADDIQLHFLLHDLS